MYAQHAPLLAPQPTLSAALTSAETRPCPCCPTFPFIYNRYIGGYTITLILQWLSIVLLVAGTATPALFLFVSSPYQLTYGLFHACLVFGTLRQCDTYQDGQAAQLLGSSHLGEQWSAFQALTVTLNVLSFAVAVLYTMRMVVVQRQRTLSKRAEVGLFGFSSVTLLLAFVSMILFLNCYSRATVMLVNFQYFVKTLGSSFTLMLTAYIMQMIALFLQSYTFVQQAKATRGLGAAAATPIRAGEPEPVPMGVVASQAAQYHPPAYMPAAAAAYQQPAFYGQAYQLPQHYMQPAPGAGVPSYYAPPQYYAPAQQMPTYTHAQPYPQGPVVHYGEQQPAAPTPQ